MIRLTLERLEIYKILRPRNTLKLKANSFLTLKILYLFKRSKVSLMVTLQGLNMQLR